MSEARDAGFADDGEWLADVLAAWAGMTCVSDAERRLIERIVRVQQARIDAALAECARLREEAERLYRDGDHDDAKAAPLLEYAADRIERALKGTDDE